MPIATLCNGLYISKPSEELRGELLRLFTYDNPQYLAALKFSPYGYVSPKIPPRICMADYDELSQTLRVPRGFSPATLSVPCRKELSRYVTKDHRDCARVEFPVELVPLNKEQRKLVGRFVFARRNKLRPHGNYLFLAPTSVGKTMAQAAIAAKTKQRTLVLCVTNLIRNAWLRDIYTLYGIPKQNVGHIQQATWRIGDIFTLASVATIDRRPERWAELFKTFGTIVLDEAHTISEPRLSRFLDAATSRYIIGATATGEKDTGVDFALPALLGEPVAHIRSQNKDTATSMQLRKVRVVKTNFTYEYDRHNLDMHDLSLTLAADEDRNALIVEQAYADWKAGHSVVIAVKRVPHIQLLLDMLHEKGVRDANPLYGGSNQKKRYTETLIKGVLSRKIRMLVANYTAIKLGGNLNPLSRLHLAWPLNRLDLTQLIGRLRRKAEKKIDSEVVYYLDHRVAYLRRRFEDKAVPVFRDMGIPGFVNRF